MKYLLSGVYSCVLIPDEEAVILATSVQSDVRQTAI
jgi:hypothetical protein